MKQPKLEDLNLTAIVEAELESATAMDFILHAIAVSSDVPVQNYFPVAKRVQTVDLACSIQARAI